MSDSGKCAPRTKSTRYTPPPPDALADALQDRVHPTSGRLLVAAPIKVRGCSGLDGETIKRLLGEVTTC